MKKNVMFFIPTLIVAVLLFMLRVTGMKTHIILSVAGLLILVAYALVTRKSWKNTALEVVERIFYAIALITGIMLMNIHGIPILSIVHKISATLFAVMLLVTEIHKAIKK